MTEPQPTDSETVAATHPRVDLLRLLSKSDHNGHSLCKELGIPMHPSLAPHPHPSPILAQ